MDPQNSPTVHEANDPKDFESIRERGWRQWAFVGNADLPSVLSESAWEPTLETLGEDARLLVVSQSCDLVHHSFESEPFIEGYLCEPLAQDAAVNGNLTAGKNPRELLVPLIFRGEERQHRLQSKGRVLISRQHLASIDPDSESEVPTASVRILQRWIINRLVRTAFPDAFNDRTGKARNKLEDLLKKKGAALLGLYVNLTPWSELPVGESYVVEFVGLVDEALDMEARTALETVFGKVAAAYAACDGVEIDYQIQDESEAPMSLLRTHRLFPLDFMSLRDKPGGELPSLS